MDRQELVELIEDVKAKLSPEGREKWDDLESSGYLTPEEENTLSPEEETTLSSEEEIRLKPHEVATIEMDDLPEADQHLITSLIALRAELYNSDQVERRGEESGEDQRRKSIIEAAMFKQRDEGGDVDRDMSLEEAKNRLKGVD